MGCKDHELIRHYEHAGMLPGGLPVGALDSYEWQNHFVALPTNVLEGRSDADQ